MLRVSRPDLLQALESIQPGLSPRDIIEQSACFVFKNGYIMTYNDEVACRTKSVLPKDFTGAVTAEPLLAILRKLPEDEVEVAAEGGEFRIRGKKRQAGITMESEVTLPIDSVDKPSGWSTLPDEFLDAVSIVHECAGHDQTQFVLTCVHIHPKYIEASDNHQLTRYRLKSGIESSFLVRRDSIKHIIALDMTEISETKSWVHFRNSAGLRLSCRRFLETFPDLNRILKMEGGEPTTLPKGLSEAVEKAEVFSSENADANQVIVQLKPGKLRIKGTGVSGWYAEVKRLKYDGQPLEFQIAPKLLIELVKRHNDCLVSPERLKVDGGKWVYVSCLEQVPDEKG